MDTDLFASRIQVVRREARRFWFTVGFLSGVALVWGIMR